MKASREEAGRISRTEGWYDPGMFAEVKTVDDFASTLGVPKKTIALVVPTNNTCQCDDCPFNAAQGNHGYCVAHSKTWYPPANKRGGDWYGPEFLRLPSGKFRACDCSMQSCKLAGYFPKQGALYVSVGGWETIVKTPGLLSRQKKNSLLNKDSTKKTNLFLYAWHFFPSHLLKDNDGQWALPKMKRSETKTQYRDLENKAYIFPPPRNIPGQFIDTVFFSDRVHPHDKWMQPNSDIPHWMLEMLNIDKEMDISRSSDDIIDKHNHDDNGSNEDWEARARSLQTRLQEQSKQHKRDVHRHKAHHNKAMKELKERYEAQLADMNHANSEASRLRSEEMKRWTDTISLLTGEKADLKQELEEKRSLLQDLRKRKKHPLTFDDLYEGGLLANDVASFTLFGSVELNDAFLGILNFTDGGPGSLPVGDGMCENIFHYSKITPTERREGITESMDMESPEYKSHLKKVKAARIGGRTWKDDYLAFCVYVRAGTTQAVAANLSGISAGRMSDIFHEWAQILDTALQEWFPTPTQSQLLRAYPSQFIEADGHAKCSMLLDAFEIFTQQSSNYNVASSTHSDYKKHCTVKFLGGTDVIGCPWAATVPDGNPGKASDVIVTKDTKILRQVPFGNTCKVDKGCIVDNLAASEGVIIDRPQKRLKKQVQQSTIDTSQTQKIGNTRIIVENVNGEMKVQVRYLNVLIPCLQFGIISKIVRIGYLLQNFKKAIIQNNEPGVLSPEDGRPCRGDIRWYGATDAGLRDVRGNVRLWGLKCEIHRHAELSVMEEHRGKSPVEISELVLDERWDLKERTKLFQLDGREYTGTL